VERVFAHKTGPMGLVARRFIFLTKKYAAA
jgi:hypothetical protein